MASVGGGGGSKSKTSSKPVDLTPAEYTALRSPIAQALMFLMATGGPQFGQATTLFPSEMFGGGGGAPTTISAPRLTAPRAITSAPRQVQVNEKGIPMMGKTAGFGDPGTRMARAPGGIVPAGSPIDPSSTTAPGRGPSTAPALAGVLSQFGGQAATQTPNSAFTAPIGANEQLLLDQLMASTQPTAVQTAGQEELLSTIRGERLGPGGNPFLSAMIEMEQRRLGEQFRDVEAPVLQSRFTRAGQNIQPQGSSAFDTAAAIALRGLTSAQGDVATQLSSANFQAERDRQLGAITQAQEISGAEASRLIDILQQQALPRLIEQYGIDQGLAEFRRRMEMIMAALGIGAQLSSPTVANVTKSSETTSPSFKFGIEK